MISWSRFASAPLQGVASPYDKRAIRSTRERTGVLSDVARAPIIRVFWWEPPPPNCAVEVSVQSGPHSTAWRFDRGRPQYRRDMMPEVVTARETMILGVPSLPGRLRHATGLELKIGGAESNVAIALSRLGVSAGWVGYLSADEPG